MDIPSWCCKYCNKMFITPGLAVSYELYSCHKNPKQKFNKEIYFYQETGSFCVYCDENNHFSQNCPKNIFVINKN